MSERNAIHLAFVLANFPPHVGGVERHVERLAAELIESGVRVTVFTLEEPGERVADGISVVGLGRHVAVGDVAALPGARPAAGLARELRGRGVTHVSVHTRFFPATWLGLWAGHRAAVPVILTEHGGGHVQTGGPAFRLATQIVDQTMGRQALRRADALLAVSTRAASFVEAISGRRPAVCGNGIDPEWWAPSGSVPDAPRLVFVGRVVAEKGWRDFLAIVEALPGVPADILGDGPEITHLRAFVSTSGLAGRVRIHGQVDPTHVRELLRGAVYVNPSTAAEGLQTTLLEAAASGARIATFDVGGAAESEQAGATIRRVTVGDLAGLTEATRQALEDRWEPPEHIERFSWPRVAGVYLEAMMGCN